MLSTPFSSTFFKPMRTTRLLGLLAVFLLTTVSAMAAVTVGQPTIKATPYGSVSVLFNTSVSAESLVTVAGPVDLHAAFCTLDLDGSIPLKPRIVTQYETVARYASNRYILPASWSGSLSYLDNFPAAVSWIFSLPVPDTANYCLVWWTVRPEARTSTTRYTGPKASSERFVFPLLGP